MSLPLTHLARRKPGFFHPVILRRRHDGWSISRQCAFLAHLYFTGSPAAAARAVGMSRESAHRLRVRAGAEGFAQAWGEVLGRPGRGRSGASATDYRKVTATTLRQWCATGFVMPVVEGGRMTGIAVKADETALSRLLHRQNMPFPVARSRTPKAPGELARYTRSA